MMMRPDIILKLIKYCSLEILYNSRQSSLFDLMAPELKKSVAEVEEEAVELVLKIPVIE